MNDEQRVDQAAKQERSTRSRNAPKVGQIYFGDFRWGGVLDLPSRLSSGADRPFLPVFLTDRAP
jgi:hypothetical protein